MHRALHRLAGPPIHSAAEAGMLIEAALDGIDLSEPQAKIFIRPGLAQGALCVRRNVDDWLDSIEDFAKDGLIRWGLSHAQKN